MNSSSWEEVRAVAADVLGLPPESLSPESSPETIESWDSVQHLNIVLALEERFELQIEPDEFEKMKDLASIRALIDEKLAAPSA